MNKETFTATISELAQLAYHLPIGKEINFSCDRNEDFWAIKKLSIFDGPLLVIGSYGGGLTSAMDIQIDGEQEEIEHFFANVLDDHTIDEVFIEKENSTIFWEEPPQTEEILEPVSYGEIVTQLRKELRLSIIELMQKRGVREVDIHQHEVYVAWFDNDNIGYDTIISSIHLTPKDEIELTVLSEDDELVHLDHHYFGCNHVEWLSQILDAVTAELITKS
ncbi:MAG: hypothetical protein SNJ29_10575 [Rikenellaceae bacterium]